MYDMYLRIMDMDAMSFYIILALSAFWSYLTYEMFGSWLGGLTSFPVFAGCSLVAVEILDRNRLLAGADDSTNVIFGTCVGSLIGVAATFLAIQLMTRISSARFEASQGKTLRDRMDRRDKA